MHNYIKLIKIFAHYNNQVSQQLKDYFRAGTSLAIKPSTEVKCVNLLMHALRSHPSPEEKMKTKQRFTKLALALAGLIATAGIAPSSVVTSWDMSNTTPVAPTAVANPSFVFDQFNYIEPG